MDFHVSEFRLPKVDDIFVVSIVSDVLIVPEFYIFDISENVSPYSLVTDCYMNIGCSVDLIQVMNKTHLA